MTHPNENEAREALIALNTMAEQFVGTIVDNRAADEKWEKREAARKVLSEVIVSRDSEKQRADKAEAELARVRHIATNNAYMRDLACQMLGPKGAQAMKLATDKGVVRMHMSWGPDAFKLSGEERADFVLNMLNLDLKDCEEVSFDDEDNSLPTPPERA